MFIFLLLLVIAPTNGFHGRLPGCIKGFRTPTLPVAAIPSLRSFSSSSVYLFGSIFYWLAVTREWSGVGVAISFLGLSFWSLILVRRSSFLGLGSWLQFDSN